MIKIFVLTVILSVNSGSIINFQEFTSIEQCNYTRQLILNSDALRFNTKDAFCTAK